MTRRVPDQSYREKGVGPERRPGKDTNRPWFPLIHHGNYKPGWGPGLGGGARGKSDQALKVTQVGKKRSGYTPTRTVKGRNQRNT